MVTPEAKGAVQESGKRAPAHCDGLAGQRGPDSGRLAFCGDTIVDVSSLTPDQQFEAGLHCGSVHATPTVPIRPTGLCPASQYGSSLVKIPAPGTENDDPNPPRIAWRKLFDIAIGHDNLFNSDHHKWSLRPSVVNLTNKEALYNFLSTFYVTPRAVTGTIGFHF
jgi:hypothetical protein